MDHFSTGEAVPLKTGRLYMTIVAVLPFATGARHPRIPVCVVGKRQFLKESFFSTNLSCESSMKRL